MHNLGFWTRLNAIGWGASQTLWSAAAILFAMLSLGYFLYLTVPFIAYGSLCCADDGFFAMSARLLAERGIYGLPMSSKEISVFEPTVGSGPAFIFPGAWMIRGFGPKAPVPGAVIPVYFLTQLLLSFIVLIRRYSWQRSLLFVSLLLLLVQLTSGYQWYFGVYVGEVPAFGYVLLGILLLADSRGFLRLFAAGLIFGLAYLTKPDEWFIDRDMVMLDGG
jgi:hypothetical protein